MNHFVRRYSAAGNTARSLPPGMGAPAPADREHLARAHVFIVKQIAGRIASRLPGHYEIDDLYSAGVLGLLTAIDNFDESKGIPFDKYARIRIEGAILDALRESDHLPRTRRQKNKKIEATRRELEKEKGAPVSDAEVAKAAGMTTESVQSSMIDAIAPTYLAPNDLASVAPASDKPDDDPFERIHNAQVLDRLSSAIDELPERLKLVMSLYYREELSYKEIGRVLNISESRVAHLHADAVKKLRVTLGEA